MPGATRTGPTAVGVGGRAGLVPLPGTSLPLLTWPSFDRAAVHVAVTTRAGGISTGRYASLNLALHVGDDDDAVLQNRARVAAAIGVGLDDLAFGEQVHGKAVTIVDGAQRGRGARAAADAVPASDALVTTTAGVVLVVMVADCVPIVLHDPVAGVLACVHAGWGGTVRGVTPAAVTAMIDLGADPEDIVAGIGPAISADTYQVGDDVAAHARAAFAGRADLVLHPDGTGRFLFDLVGAARLQLTDAGVRSGNIHDSGCVTGPGTPFYSHRGEQPCGRFAVLARLLPRTLA